MKTHLWKINNSKLKKTNLAIFSNYIKKKYKFNSKQNFEKIWKWSIKNPRLFWKSIWEFTKVKGVLGKTIVKKSKIFYKNKFFPDSKINYAENLLIKNNSDPAIIFKSENGYRTCLTWENLNLNVLNIIF